MLPILCVPTEHLTKKWKERRRRKHEMRRTSDLSVRLRSRRPWRRRWRSQERRLAVPFSSMTAVIGAVAGTMDARTAAAAAATSTLRGGGGRRVGVAGAVARREAALSTDQRVVLPFAFFFLLQSLFVARSSLNSLSNLNGTEDRPHVGMVQRNLVVITDRAAQQERILC